MKRVYYGTCLSDAATETKMVTVPDTDISTENNFQFTDGDLLVVFFENTNKAATPTISVVVEDTNNNGNTSNNDGREIKSYDDEAELVDAWGAGETIIFVYTQVGSNSERYVWEMVNGVHASLSTYGDTKLFDPDLTEVVEPYGFSFVDWVKREPEADNPYDQTMALAPNTLKKLYQMLAAQSDDDDGVGQLRWAPAGEGSTIEIGTLQLLDGDEQSGVGVKITIPSSVIPTVKDITHTGQLKNNGDGIAHGQTTNIDETFPLDKYITSKPPESLYFITGEGLKYYYTSDEEEKSVLRFIPNNSDGKIVIGNSSDNTLNGIIIGKNLKVNEGLEVVGNPGSISATGDILSKGGVIYSLPKASSVKPPNISSGSIYATGPIYENGVSLVNTYSKKIRSVTKQTQEIRIAPNTLKVDQIYVDNEEGWTPWGILGYNITNYGKNGQGASWCLPFSMMYYEYEGSTRRPRIKWNIRNMHSTQTAIVYIDFRVLYVKN